MYNRVSHFEIHATDPKMAGKFYGEIFGWKVEEWLIPGVEIAPENRYWMITTAPADSQESGINGGIMVRKGDAPKGGEPMTSFVCTITVDDLDEYAKKVEAAGGKVAIAKMPIFGVGWIAYYTDCEGNIFGLYSDDKNAK